jgi:hypothetical protein
MVEPIEPEVAEAWRQLEVYADRYPIDDRLERLRSLKRTMQRRRDKGAALHRRLAQLEEMANDVRDQISAVYDEVAGSERTGALLISEILEQVRIDMGEGWSPAPVRGLRAWRIIRGRVYGAKMAWDRPFMEARCLQMFDGEDLPHSIARCGYPPCGVYALKGVAKLYTDVIGDSDRDMVIGVVELTGKVIEHDSGYRAQRAEVSAVVANCEERQLISTDPDEIALLFAEPEGTVARLGSTRNTNVEGFLIAQRDKETAWI